ncbi:MAG: BolA family protein [Alphaproteobacteria bacterium]
MSMKKRIEDKLNTALKPSHLEVVNESHEHQGHAGDDGSGESHFKVVVSSSQFNGVDRVGCQRMIYDALSAEMRVVHALSIVVKK